MFSLVRNGFTEILKSPEVSCWLNEKFDICFLSETHMTKGQSFDIENFKCIHHPFSDVLDKKPRGGMMCLVKLDVWQYVTKVNRDTPDNITITLHGGHSFFGAYIPPSDSIYYSDIQFTCIPNAFSNDDNSHVIIGGGDLNSRVGNITQNIPGASYRPNVDTVVNTHGRMLKRICNSYNCYVLNNLSIGNLNLDGDYTFFKGGRKSQNDICVSNMAGLQNIKSFCIEKIGWNFSDHFPISVVVNLDLYDSAIPLAASADILTSTKGEMEKRASKVQSDQVDWQAYRVIAGHEVEMLQGKIESLKLQPDSEILNEVVDTLSDKLYKTAKTCESKLENEPMQQLPISTSTPVMREADGKLIMYSSGLCSWGDWDEVRKNAVGDISGKQFVRTVLQWNETLTTKDSKKIWDRINWKGDVNNNEPFEQSPEAEDLAAQFKSKDIDFEEDLMSLDFGENSVPVLDDEISLEDIKKASSKLKEGKSTSDGWVPKMVIGLGDILYPVLIIIFNVILRCSIFPCKWWYSVVVALFKFKGSRSVSKNFRPVSLVVMLSKLFDFVLLNRFKKWFRPHDMQTAYQEGKSCSDHIFFMRCLIQRFILDKRKLFITAVDFDGAFDRVKRSTLLRKLVTVGASSVFVCCLANLYSVSRNTVYCNGASVTYMLFSGIKQGLPLSPYLFLFYIDDIFDYLESASANLIADIFDKLHILIHADDANLIACSKELMVRKLRSLLCYCQSNSIILQPSKCFFMVINGSVDDKCVLQISDNDVVTHKEHLEILGSHLSGNLKNDLELHFKKRFKNVIKYFNFIKVNKVAPVSVKLKVLKSCVMSTLLYNCEAFGPNMPEGLEEIYLKMLRAALGVRTNCPNLIVFVESGCLPIQCLIRARQLNFFRRFKKSLQQDSARKSIFDHLLAHSTKFLSHYVELDNKYTNSDTLIAEYMENVKKSIKNLGSNKDSHYKYWIYLQMNPELTLSPFLNRIDCVGKSMIKFRLGSHRLKIETGRWTRTPRENRLCPTCNELGDEYHVIYECREIFRGDLTELPPNLSSIWTYPKINTLFKRIVEAEFISSTYI